MITKVKLRTKKISKGRKSLYLDFYPPIPHPKTGKPTRREFLGLYVYEKPKNPIDKAYLALKKMGFPEEVFTRAGKILKIVTTGK